MDQVAPVGLLNWKGKDELNGVHPYVLLSVSEFEADVVFFEGELASRDFDGVEAIKLLNTA